MVQLYSHPVSTHNNYIPLNFVLFFQAPYPVKALSTLHCTAIAAARDHTVILTKRYYFALEYVTAIYCIAYLYSGAVFTCGLNDAHQLGHGSNPSNAPPNYLAPKQVCACFYLVCCTYHNTLIYCQSCSNSLPAQSSQEQGSDTDRSWSLPHCHVHFHRALHCRKEPGPTRL